MTRNHIAALCMLLLAGLLVFDQMTTPPNPWRAPVMIAFGSGTAASGGFCGALPN